MEFITKREPCSPPFTCTCYKNKLLNNRSLAANSKCLQHWPFHPPGDDLPWFTSISWSESATSHHWQLLHSPEFNLPLGIRISVWLETLKVGYNPRFRASSLHAPLHHVCKTSVNAPQSIFFCRAGGKRVHKNNHSLPVFLMHFKPKPSSSTEWKVPTQQIHKNAEAERHSSQREQYTRTVG